MSKILVIWDVMLDKFSFWEVKRLNPEWPNPLLNISKEEYRLGWAANVWANIASLAWNCDLFWCIWDDLNWKTFLGLLNENNINFTNITKIFSTITKQRFIEKTYNQQMLRVDYEEKMVLNKENIDFITDKINKNNYSFLVISDYNKWVFTRELFEKLKEIWDKKWIKILVDSKPKNYEFISWVYLLKPNFKEFIEIIWKDLENTDENIEKYWIKLAKIKNSNIVITRWAKWASLIELNWKITHTKTEVKQVFDVTGAWDTFISAVVYALFVWKNLQESIELGNKASSIVVWKVGTEKISKEELWI